MTTTSCPPVAAGFRFLLLDRDERAIGELHPYLDAAMASMDVSRAVQRDVTSVTLTPSEQADVKPASDRVSVEMVLTDGSTHPIGRFLFADNSRAEYSYGTPLTTSLVDKGLILDQLTETSVAVSSSASVRQAIISLLDEVGLASVVDSPVTTTVGGPMSWPAGTSRRQIISDLGLVGALMPPYFDAVGVCNVRSVVNPDTAPAAIEYEDNVLAASTVETDDLLSAPNRIVVVGSDASPTPIFGAYDVSASAPHSRNERGFYVTQVITQQGLANSAAAQAAAKAYALSRTVFSYVTFSSPPDYRHEPFAVVGFGGSRWVEQAWTMPLAAGGEMVHTLKKVYAE